VTTLAHGTTAEPHDAKVVFATAIANSSGCSAVECWLQHLARVHWALWRMRVPATPERCAAAAAALDPAAL